MHKLERSATYSKNLQLFTAKVSGYDLFEGKFLEQKNKGKS